MENRLSGHMQRRPTNLQGQTMAEFALAMPVLVLLIGGMFLAGFYAFRASSADWGVFITGVGTGSYKTPATSQAKSSVLWQDIRSRLSSSSQNGTRSVRSTIAIHDSHSWAFGLHLIEAERGSAWFRLWRFYPGPPPRGGLQ